MNKQQAWASLLRGENPSINSIQIETPHTPRSSESSTNVAPKLQRALEAHTRRLEAQQVLAEVEQDLDAQEGEVSAPPASFKTEGDASKSAPHKNSEPLKTQSENDESNIANNVVPDGLQSSGSVNRSDSPKPSKLKRKRPQRNGPYRRR